MRLLTLHIILLFSLNSFGQDSLCVQKMKVGTFKYVDKQEGVVIVRTKNKQIEYSEDQDWKLVLKVRWVNDSTYVLTHKKSINIEGCLKKGTEIIVTIVACEGDRFKAVYTTEECGDGESWFELVD